MEDGPLVLVVDDDEVNQELATKQLERLGCLALVAEDGLAARVMVASERPALVLMDCMMSGMDGFAATRAIREDERVRGDGEHTPIIALTAQATPVDREACFAAGMDDYLAKPVRLEDLRPILAKWIEVTPAVAASGGAPGPEESSIEDEELARKIRGLYLERLDTRVIAIRSAVDRQDPPALREAAHALRGPSLLLDAAGLVEVCKKLEDLGRSGFTDGAGDLLIELDQQASVVRADLEDPGSYPSIIR